MVKRVAARTVRDIETYYRYCTYSILRIFRSWPHTAVHTPLPTRHGTGTGHGTGTLWRSSTHGKPSREPHCARNLELTPQLNSKDTTLPLSHVLSCHEGASTPPLYSVHRSFYHAHVSHRIPARNDARDDAERARQCHRSSCHEYGSPQLRTCASYALRSDCTRHLDIGAAGHSQFRPPSP